ncbi:MAG: metalloregulator ArsR/SmtB family transcription factor [Anaeromyxobacter sp.]|nr:metalloregulator ArsR/SmtB family transcription factor [Anaeromyxobacter sp.]MBL0278149.1 metalloregulator ArsR/SmtB family transcription factor [Anaeromyxobacter sp.]
MKPAPAQPPAADPSRPAALLGWMDGLADETRLRLLRVLEREALSVQELCDVLRLPQSTVSRHLKTLSDQGWLTSRRQGTASFYAFSPDAEAGARRLWKLARAETEAWAAAGQDELRLEARLKARRAGAQEFFAGAAQEWEALRAELYGAAFEREALGALLPPDWIVADLGCGAGTLTAALAPHVARVIGVDQSAAMLRTARRRLDGAANVELHRAGLEALPLPAASCDAALLVLVLAYVPEVAPVLAEAARILRPGGRLVLVDLARHDDQDFARRLGQARLGFAPADLTRALAAAGLAGATVRPLPPEPGAKGPALLLATAHRPGP